MENKKRGRGKVFEGYVSAILRERYKRNECIYIRIPDARSFGFISQSVPGDFLIFLENIDILLECKESANKRGFPKQNLRKNQINSLRRFRSKSREGFLLIRSVAADKKCYLFNSSQLEVFEEVKPAIIPWNTLEELSCYAGSCAHFFDFFVFIYEQEVKR